MTRTHFAATFAHRSACGVTLDLVTPAATSRIAAVDCLRCLASMPDTGHVYSAGRCGHCGQPEPRDPADGSTRRPCVPTTETTR